VKKQKLWQGNSMTSLVATWPCHYRSYKHKLTVQGLRLRHFQRSVPIFETSHRVLQTSGEVHLRLETISTFTHRTRRLVRGFKCRLL